MSCLFRACSLPASNTAENGKICSISIRLISYFRDLCLPLSKSRGWFSVLSVLNKFCFVATLCALSISFLLRAVTSDWCLDEEVVGRVRRFHGVHKVDGANDLLPSSSCGPACIGCFSRPSRLHLPPASQFTRREGREHKRAIEPPRAPDELQPDVFTVALCASVQLHLSALAVGRSAPLPSVPALCIRGKFPALGLQVRFHQSQAQKTRLAGDTDVVSRVAVGTSVACGRVEQALTSHWALGCRLWTRSCLRPTRLSPTSQASLEYQAKQ